MNMVVVFLLCLNIIKLSLAVDTVVRPEPVREWVSQTFIIPSHSVPNNMDCGNYSKFYCLHAYETRDTVDGVSVQDHFGVAANQVLDHILDNVEERGEEDL